MPKQYKLTRALELINRQDPYTVMDDVATILQNLIDDGEYVKDWTADEIAEFVLQVVRSL